MIRLLFVFGMIGLLAGCGDGNPPTYPVTGKVTYKSQPMGGALVVFHPLDSQRVNEVKPFAKSNEDGSYTLSLLGMNDGAREGEYGVTVIWNGPTKTKEAKFGIGGGEGGPATSDKLGGRYGDPRSPKFKVTVKKGEKNHFEFDAQ